MPYEAVNTRGDAPAIARWEADGRPLVPAVVVEGRVTSVLHPAQLSSLVGVPSPPGLETVRVAWDLTAILQAWIDEIEALRWDELQVPTPSRGRTLAHLTVNVFVPIPLLPHAWRTHDFPWRPEEDDPRVEAGLASAEQVVGYAREVLLGFLSDLQDLEPELAGDDDPMIDSPRGSLSYSVLLTSQRWHAGFHLAQLIEFLRLQGASRVGQLDPRNLQGLDLPDDVFGFTGP